MTLPVVLLAVLAGALGYVSGRLHQWRRDDWDRDEAYRDGYDTAARSTFSLAARMVAPRRSRDAVRGAAPVVRPEPAPTTSPGRHGVPDELVRAATYRLAPDRVARAKVIPGQSPQPAPDPVRPSSPDSPAAFPLSVFPAPAAPPSPGGSSATTSSPPPAAADVSAVAPARAVPRPRSS